MARSNRPSPPSSSSRSRSKTGGYQAEYGGALGGFLNVVTKSGSNAFHGDVFGYFNNDALTAKTLDQTWTFTALDRTEDPNECGGPGTGRGTDCPRGNPNFGSPVGYQGPRFIRLGVRLTW